MGLYKDRIIADTTTPADGDSIVSYLYASDGTALGQTAGSLDVNITNAGDIEVAINAEYAEDSVAADASELVGVGAVRQDSLAASVSADGDWGWLKLDSVGRLWTNAYLSGQAADITVDINAQSVGALDVEGSVADDAADAGNPVKVGSQAVDGALTAISATGDRANAISDLYRRLWINDAPNVGSQYGTATVGTTAGELMATPLAGRKRILLQNLSTATIYLGTDNSVTTANGIRLARNAAIELPYGEDLNVWAIANVGASNDVRYMEIG